MAFAGWKLAACMAEMAPMAIQEMLRLTQGRPIINLAGGLPSPRTFPVEALAEASQSVLLGDGVAALQYSSSEGYAPLRRLVASRLPWPVDPDQVLITTGSQQGLDLLGRALVNPGDRVLVESPTYPGALQAFRAIRARPCGVATDADGALDLNELRRQAIGDPSAQARARFFYCMPNFQNPSGRLMPASQRASLSAAAATLNLPIVEDDPYAELWFGEAPPKPLTALNPEGCVYLGSFSKVMAPGLRLGYLVAPPAIYESLVQLKQGADLHTPIFNQRLVHAVLERAGYFDEKLRADRAFYRRQRDLMLAALAREMPDGVQWNVPDGGMFIWVRLPVGVDADALLPQALASGVAFLPASGFHAGTGKRHALRLSYATAEPAEIEEGVAQLARAVRAGQAAL